MSASSKHLFPDQHSLTNFEYFRQILTQLVFVYLECGQYFDCCLNVQDIRPLKLDILKVIPVCISQNGKIQITVQD